MYSLSPYALDGMYSLSPYALKGQKLLAQGIALGLECNITKSPCKGKSFKYKKLLPLQGDFLAYA